LTDERNKLADQTDAVTADDAVTNRSDDTAIDEERNGAEAQDREPGAELNDAKVRDETSSPEVGKIVNPEEVTVTEEVGVDVDGDLGNEQQENEQQENADAEQMDDEDVTEAGPTSRAPAGIMEPEPEEEIRMDWYILKVQSNRERSIAEALERKIRVEGLDEYFDQVIVPTEKVTEFKGGKKKVVERKLYPGYIVVHMHINDNTWFAVRETSGVGDFTGAGGKPTPMLAHEVSRIVQTEEEETSEAPKLDIRFSTGDKVKVKEGNFESFEGEVGSIDEASGRVTVMINIFGRSTPVELEYWQIEAV
jgi:transcription termination/antitermination protein NusG